MKKIFIFLFSLLAFLFISSSSVNLYANELNSPDDYFKIEVGKNNYISPILETTDGKDGLDPITPGDYGKLRLFAVKITQNYDQPKRENDPVYKWIHEMCFVVDGNATGCEIDEIEEIEITYEHYHLRHFYASQSLIPFYYEDVDDDIQITFKNSFICLDYCYSDFSFPDITLTLDDKDPVFDNINSQFHSNENIINDNIIFNLKFDDNLGIDQNKVYYLWTTLPLYEVFISEVNNPFILQTDFSTFPEPFLNFNAAVNFNFVVLAFDYAGNFGVFDMNYAVNSNIPDLILNEQMIVPENDGIYKEILIDFSNVENYKNFKYKISSFETFTYVENMLDFDHTSPLILDNLWNNSSYYLYITCEDDLGNIYSVKRKVNIDLEPPIIESYNHTPNVNPIKQAEVNVLFKDYQNYNQTSGLDENNLYYLWSNRKLTTNNDYELINNSYTNNEVISLDNVDGEWYLYFKVSDLAGNEQIFHIIYIFDNTPPVLAEAIPLNNPNNILKQHKINIEVTDSTGLSSELIACGWFLENDLVTDYSRLTEQCLNNSIITSSSNLEGNYYLWLYVEDTLGNNDLIKVDYLFKIDNKRPSLNYEIEKDFEIYSFANKINLNFSDSFSGINDDSIYYLWTKENEIVNQEQLTNKISTSGNVVYPENSYGKYKLWVKASDVAGNTYFASLNETFYIDTELVNLLLIGNDKISLIVGESFQDPGAIAYKGNNVAQGRKLDVITTSDLNLNKPGSYYIMYVAGSDENQLVVFREIVVEPSKHLIITLFTILTLGLFAFIFQMEFKKNSSKYVKINVR